MQFSAIGHVSSYFGQTESRARELILQWYMDNINSLHKVHPSSLELFGFFIELESSQMGTMLTLLAVSR